jgi:hypothetical protein
MLGRVKGDKMNMLLKDHPGLFPRGIHSRLIGYQPHALALEKIEIIILKDIDPQFDGVNRYRRKEGCD